MKMDFGLYQHQSMKLVMTNELRQAITMLQYSALDLKDYLHEQQLENPLIELKENHLLEEAVRKKDDLSWNTIDGKQRNYNDDNYSVIDHVKDNEGGLQGFLLNQIRLLTIDNQLRKVVTYIALSIDENGYLGHSIEEMAIELQEPVSLIQEALNVLQTLEPVGVGAANLKECLLIQLRQLAIRDLYAEEVVEKYLDLLGKKQFKQIAKQINIDVDEVQYIADFIQTLNPKPGAAFHNEPAKYVVPDVTVKKVKGQYLVFLNNEHLPVMTVNKRYEDLIKNGEAEVSQYMKQKYEQFQWIKRSIEQRQQTLLNVTKAIVEHQVEFFDEGPGHLKPLTLKTIAEKIQVHESTVSRATTKKYIQTPRGLYELKYFFTSTVGKNSDDSASSERVKIFIKGLVDEENKKKPLSDQKLSDLLMDQYGIKVSRRTVAKYRDEMHILSSSQRKRYE
ncbi:MAG: RNA polymerase factor sigma-54 [Bacillus sp. (in: Bacteria)]|nr:RNA polymerase factor sigma-54 [Bacillus sp. (in: firmicutes)]